MNIWKSFLSWFDTKGPNIPVPNEVPPPAPLPTDKELDAIENCVYQTVLKHLERPDDWCVSNDDGSWYRLRHLSGYRMGFYKSLGSVVFYEPSSLEVDGNAERELARAINPLVENYIEQNDRKARIRKLKELKKFFPKCP